MRDFWVTFTGRAKPGSVRDETMDLARVAAEAKYGEAVRTIDPIPYPGFPILIWKGPSGGDFSPRCSDPMRCRGKNGCQKRPSCTE